MRRLGGVALIMVLAVAGCSSGGSPPSTAALTSTCSDAAGDGGALDISSVELRVEPSGVAVTIDTVAPIPTDGLNGFFVQVSSADGNTSRQLGVKYQDGQQIAHFVFDEPPQENLDLPASIAGSRFTAEFPPTAVSGLGEGWGWYATTTRDAADVDSCPEPGSNTLDRPRVTVTASP